MAEALREVGDPLASIVTVGEAAPAAEVARAMARSLALARSSVAPPEWLRPPQRISFGRGRAALDRYGIALLAEPVGSGKSWIALALAAAENGGGPATVIVPAALMDQWRMTAERAGVSIQLWSQERLSRGRRPDSQNGLVIIDESHRFRNPDTRRYQTIAPWLIGRRVLLLSATPVVNRLDDLTAQLLLGLRGDGLRLAGLPSLRFGKPVDAGRHCLGEVVVSSIGTGIGGPVRRDSVIALPQAVPAELIVGLEGLAHSRQRPIARLLQGVIWFAAASSPAALLAVLTSYRALLLHARDALSQERPMSRTALREFTGGLSEQLVLWSLFESASGLASGELDLNDLARLDALIPQTRSWMEGDDIKRQQLEMLLRDARPTLVFTSARATVRYLRDTLPSPVAWSIGGEAGLGYSAMPREVVWSWFAPEGRWLGVGPRPATLICTDVAAEGLNLQHSDRVIHYDLPWTPMRLAQRDGRAIRLGSLHAQVDVVRFLPAPEIERRFGITRLLAGKLRLPSDAGLGAEGRTLWRWRDDLAQLAATGEATCGCAAIERSGLPPGALVAVLLRAEAIGAQIPVLFWLPQAGEPSEAIADVEPRLQLALECRESSAPDRFEVEIALTRLWPALRARLAMADRNRWRGHRPAPESRILARRLHGLLAAAARRRDRLAISLVDRGLRFVARGHTAGEAMLAAELTGLRDRLLLERLARLPEREAQALMVVPSITGLIVFR